MHTKHTILNIDALKMNSHIDDESVDLVITSPPYPMIKMWDEIFEINENEIKTEADVNSAFLKATQFLNNIWEKVDKSIKPGGIVCINIGDATRNLGGNFRLFSNSGQVINFFIKKGYLQLPSIIWRKQTNAPNKFMGSGMLPAGAYATLEHEWILIFRKGITKREFKNAKDKSLRNESAFFWEERNVWFSDLWDFKGIKQKNDIKNSRDRTAAYPIELPYRLISMFSVKNDIVFDPFLGTGTTTLASMLLQRNSIGVEIDKSLCNHFKEYLVKNDVKLVDNFNDKISKRISSHTEFVKKRVNKGKLLKHYNSILGTEVMTSQEKFISFNKVSSINKIDDKTFEVIYKTLQSE